MGAAQSLLGVGEGTLEQRDRLIQPPGILVGAGEVVTEGQCAGVGDAQSLLGVGEGTLEQRDRLIQPPGRPISPGDIIAEVKVSGSALPRSCSESARVRSNRAIASSSRPASS